MTTTKSWNKLTTIIEEITSDAKKSVREKILESWNERKSDVVKLFGRTSQKKAKDPNAPKKPYSGYIMFCNEERPAITGMKNAEIMKELGKRWGKLSDKKKAKYNKMAEKDKERYQKEMENYTPPDDLELPATKKKKTRDGPKRPQSSYLYYCQSARSEIKEENPDMQSTDITKELGRRWREFSDDEKAPFIKLAEKDKKRYQKEMEASGKTKETKEASPKKKKAAVKASPKKETARTKAIKKTPGYELFLTNQKEQLESEHPDWSARKITTELNKMWREMSEEDQQNYEVKAEGSDSEDSESESESESDSDSSESESDEAAEAED